MTTDDPPRNMLPTFTQPRPTATLDPPTEATPATDPDPTPPRRRWGIPSLAGDGGPSATAPPSRETSGAEDIPTAISSIGKPKPAEVTALVVGLLGVVVVGASWVVRWRSGRKLREPTKTQRHDIAAPIGRIMLRRFDMALLGPDIADALEAAAATGAYLSDGPLTAPRAAAPAAGDLPADLQEAPA